MKILVITQNYPPDLGAGAFRMKALVNELNSRGHKVTVLTGVPNRYDSIEWKSKNENAIERIVRIKVPKQKGNLFLRGISYSIFFIKAFLKAIKLASDSDAIVATTPQLLVAYIGAIVSHKRKIPLILDVRDLWPDVMLDMNLTQDKSIVYKILKKIELYCYKHADRIVINSPAFFEPIKKLSGKEPILITNGIDDELFELLSEADPIKIEDQTRYIITYAGNVGIAQDLDVLIKLAKKFEKKYIFRIIGDGSAKEKLMESVIENKIQNIEFINPVPRKKLQQYYKETDAFFVHLKDIDMFKKTIPSKVFEYVATGKPVVYGLKGISRTIMEELQGKQFSFEPSNPNSLKIALTELFYTLKENNYKNKKGIALLKEKYLRSRLSENFSEIIEGSLKNDVENNNNKELA